MCDRYEWFELERAAEEQRRRQRADEVKRQAPSGTPPKPAEPKRREEQPEPV